MKPLEIFLWGCKTPMLLTEGTCVLPPDFHVGVLAHGLSQVNRFTGQTKTPFSVAEHTVELLRLARKQSKISSALSCAILIHDGPECLGINDLNTHVKSEWATQVRSVEHVIGNTLWERYKDGSSLSWEDMEYLLKPWDIEIGRQERQDLILGTRVNHWEPLYAEARWLYEWKHFYKGRNK